MGDSLLGVLSFRDETNRDRVSALQIGCWSPCGSAQVEILLIRTTCISTLAEA